jgi:hypothetical protein
MAQTVKEFVSDSYQLISASSPTVPLHGNDTAKGVQFLNELLSAYSATGLMTTIAQQVDFILPIGQENIIFAAPTFLPAPDVPSGRLSNLQNAWLTLENVTYPLIIENRNVFYASYKFDPQLGLPRFVIVTNFVDYTNLRFYPAASQVYTVSVYAKFELPLLLESGDMSSLPSYYIRFLRLALAKDLAFYKGRAEAWTEKLEAQYMDAKKDMESVSSVNLDIETEQESFLNGSWRVRAGI